MAIATPLTKHLGQRGVCVTLPKLVKPSGGCRRSFMHIRSAFATTYVEYKAAKPLSSKGIQNFGEPAKIPAASLWQCHRPRYGGLPPIFPYRDRKRYVHSQVATAKPSKQCRIQASYYRGGTSRAPIFLQKDLPADRKDWAPIFRAVIGSPDPNGRQLDGLGGGISSLSKICVVGPPTHPKADVDFTFVQLGIKTDEVDYSGNCGNMLAAIGPFAVDSGLVSAPRDGATTVVIHNTNTHKLISSTFPVVAGEAAAAGPFAIDGVAGTGAPVQLAFLDPAGSKTGALLPTGNAVDAFDGVPTTCVDAGNPCCFVAARSLGVAGALLPAAMAAHPQLIARLEAIRRQAAVAMGVSADLASTPGAIPKISIVAAPAAGGCLLLSGERQAAAEVDIVVRAVSGGDPHRAVPMTVALAVAAAGGVEGSVVAGLLGLGRVGGEGGVTVGHASGKVRVAATFDGEGGLETATVFRTARRLMSGWVYWKRG